MACFGIELLRPPVPDGVKKMMPLCLFRVFTDRREGLRPGARSRIVSGSAATSSVKLSLYVLVTGTNKRLGMHYTCAVAIAARVNTKAKQPVCRRTMTSILFVQLFQLQYLIEDKDKG